MFNLSMQGRNKSANKNASQRSGVDYPEKHLALHRYSNRKRIFPGGTRQIKWILEIKSIAGLHLHSLDGEVKEKKKIQSHRRFVYYQI